MAKKEHIKRVVLPVPQTLDQANEYLRRIGAARRQISRAQDGLNTQIADLQETVGKVIAPIEDECKALVDGLYAFAQANRAALTEHDKTKKVKLPAGEFFWKWTPFSVVVEGVKEVIQNLKKRRLKRFIRVKEEIDKEALLKELDVARKIPGVTVSQREQFFICPVEVQVDISGIAGKEKLTSIKVSERKADEEAA